MCKQLFSHVMLFMWRSYGFMVSISRTHLFSAILELYALMLRYSSQTLNKTRKIGYDELLISLLSLTLFGTGFVRLRREDLKIL